MSRVVGFLTLVLVVGCGSSTAASPFVHGTDAGSDATTGPRSDSGVAMLPNDSGATPASADAGVAGEWGGPCVDDGECDDGLDCTTDACDAGLSRCHFVANDSACDDSIYCNGQETCVPALGCRPGEPVACSDGTACTIDSCDESTQTCHHVPRDADGDGDPDGNCEGGGDCNDTDPFVSSLQKEVCSDGIDNNCDGRIDEAKCVAPKYDRCNDALVVRGSGTFSLDATSAHSDYTARCLPSTNRFRDLVVSIVVPKGAATDVDVVVVANDVDGNGVADGDVALGSFEQCGDSWSEVSCAAGVGVGKTRVARLRLRAPAPGTYPLYVFTDSTSPVALTVAYEAPVPQPENETCGTAAPLPVGTHVLARLTGTQRDLTTACGEPAGELVYDVTLDAVSDVHLFAAATDAYGTPIVSLRGVPCSGDHAEIGCHEGDSLDLYRRALPPGHYFVAVGATGPSDVDLVVETAAPTQAPADENCSGAPVLEQNRTIGVDLADHVDDLQLGCAVGAPDAAYALRLTEPSDVLLLEFVSIGDRGAVSLSHAACSEGTKLVACSDSAGTPVQASARSVAPGDYRVIVESDLGSPVSVTALVRPATPATLVPFSDVCETAAEIPEGGGTFQGNTANATDDFSASCDVGGGPSSPDQILHLHLDAPRRVVLDGRGTAYSAIVDVRSGSECPGTEVTGGCSEGAGRDASFLDLQLSAGDYWVQIDGYRGASGAWTLDVYVVP